MAKDKEEAQDKEGGKKKGKGKLLIIIVAVVVLIVAGVAVKMFVLGGKKKAPAKAKTEQTQQPQEQQAAASPPPPQPEPTYSPAKSLSNLTPVVIGPIIVNLADVGGDRYLKIKLVLLEAKGAAKEEKKEGEKTGVSLQDAIIRDTIITVLSSKTSDDLLSVSGKEELKNELITAINQALGEPLVRKIYFLTFIIQ